MLEDLESMIEGEQCPFIHRDLSWIQFNRRVLNQAEDNSNPLLERLKFLGITASNLDEFFLIRFASLKKQLRSLSKIESSSSTKQSSHLIGIRNSILSAVREFLKLQDQAFNKLKVELSHHKVDVFDPLTSSDDLRDLAKNIYIRELGPENTLLDRLPIESLGQLENLQTAVCMEDGTLIRIPRHLPKLYWQPWKKDRVALFYCDDLILSFHAQILNLTGKAYLVRLSRDADVPVDIHDEDPSSIPDLVKSKVRARDAGKVVRLQIRNPWKAQVSQKVFELKIDNDQIFYHISSFDMPGNFRFVNRMANESLLSKTLFAPTLKPFIPRSLKKSGQIFKKLLEHDYLLHHPYDSFECYVNFIEEAANDPHVKSIQQTVYRTDTLSRVTEILKTAAMNGKRVRVFIEPRARFDELNNIQLADDLRKCGVDVIFSKSRLKLHAKVALIERTEGRLSQRFTHLSTGNYNAETARIYTDLAILTADTSIGEDARIFFEALAEGVLPRGFQKLVLAPTQLHRKLLQLIDLEIKAAKEGRPARIFAKANALVDRQVVEKLYEASQAGVKVNLIIRGACSLVPGRHRISENIRVFSIVDKFLEHSRLYYFESSNEIYCSSADWMPRNFFSRLELAFPILDEPIRDFLKHTFTHVYLEDREKAKELSSKASWQKRRRTQQTELRAQIIFEKISQEAYKGTPLERSQNSSSK